jgi:hypothetical protein
MSRISTGQSGQPLAAASHRRSVLDMPGQKLLAFRPGEARPKPWLACTCWLGGYMPPCRCHPPERCPLHRDSPCRPRALRKSR